jgi:Lhr-like helicase
VGTPEDHLSWAHPVVREWFTSRFGTPTEPQIAGWPHILARRNTLISAPTGSGKTLAAFLACIDSLVRQSLAGALPERTQVLYISPLKALGNDVQKNLDLPLFEIQQLAAAQGFLMPGIRTMVRTGDTPARDRARMLKLPPHILVTTPESLYILLTAARSRETLRHVHTVIVDEIHALANNKRGAHLAISLERLDAITHTRPNRIGLSATQRPISLIAEFLSGNPPQINSEPSIFETSDFESARLNKSGGPHPPSFGECGNDAPTEPIGLKCHPERSEATEVFGLECHPERSEGPLHPLYHPHRSKLFNQQSISPATDQANPRAPHPPGECGDDNARAAHSSPSSGLEWESCITVVIPSTRQLDLAIELPSTELGPIASNTMWDEIYDRLQQLALEHRSTLVFVNTRRLVERISHRLSERMGAQLVAAHHGSLSRHLRLESERRLKQGECRILIATASLELGIDIGNVDLVCQIGSPRAIATALQRVGRAGHWCGAIPKGRFFATTRDELVECAAIIRAIRQSDLDRLTLPECPLDILAQQIVAACAADEWDEDALFALIRRARNYRDLTREAFDKVLVMLSDGISAKRGRFGAYLHRDQVNHRLRARRGSRLAAITSGGAIPETALFNVVALPQETVIGTLDEDFAVESHAGDIMLLGNTSWRIHRVESRTGRVLVEDAHGQPPNIPFWRGEAPARTAELSAQVAELRHLLSLAQPSNAGSNPEQSRVAHSSPPSGLEWGSSSNAAADAGANPGGPHPPSFGECGNDAPIVPSVLASHLDAPTEPIGLECHPDATTEPVGLECHPERSEGPLHHPNLPPRPKLFNPQSISPPPNNPLPGGPHPPSFGECGDDATTEPIGLKCHPERSEGPLYHPKLSKLFNQQSISPTPNNPHELNFLDPDSLRQLTTYITEGRTVLGAVPTQRTIIAERFFDEGGGMQLIIHAPFGARINRAWGLALRKRFCRSFNFELQASATDDGINIALAEQHSFPLADVFHFLQPETVEDILQQAVLTGSPIFATRFRWDANRSLALLRFQNGKKVPPQIQRMRSDDLLAAVFPDVAACFENIAGDIKIPDHPLVEEVMKDVMHEAMDIDGLIRVLQGIRNGSIQTIAVDTPVPSQFAHEILNANPYAFLDDAPLEERRTRAVQLRRSLPASVLEEAGKLDPSAIAQVVEESRPDLRDADDLHDLLQTLILFPAAHAIANSGNGGWPIQARPSGLSGLAELHPPPVPHISAAPQDEPEPDLRTAIQNEPRVPHLRARLFGAKVGSNIPHSNSPAPLGANLETSEQFSRWMCQLVETRRAVVASAGNREFWVASEKVHDFTSIYVDVSFSPEPPQIPSAPTTPEAVLDRALLGWMQHAGPVTTQLLETLLSVNEFANPLPPAETINQVVNKTINQVVNFDFETINHKVNRPQISQASIEASFLRLEATGAILRGHFTRTGGPLEWCDRRLLARIHRLTVASLRKQIEPVTPAQFMHWLLRWQHVAPGTTLRGERGLLEVLRQLQGFEIPASAWERHIFARRIANYDSANLDHLCLMGVAAWGRLSPHPATLDVQAHAAGSAALSQAPAAGSAALSQAPAAGSVAISVPNNAAPRIRRIVPTSVAPITFFLREDCAWMQPRREPDAAPETSNDAPERGFSASAELVLNALRRRGASFFAELLRVTSLDKTEVERGLWELVAAGYVTADGFENLRGLISKTRLAAASSRGKRPPNTGGRWSLLWSAEDDTAPQAIDPQAGTASNASSGANESAARAQSSTQERIEATCWMLLRRYGIVFRELLARESNLPKWRELQWAFRRLEDRGEVRGGRFVSGFAGEQFAMPLALESVRETRHLPASGELITISAADPLNLVGIIVPGERIPAIGPRTVAFCDGVYVPDSCAPAPLSLRHEAAAGDSSGCEAAV